MKLFCVFETAVILVILASGCYSSPLWPIPTMYKSGNSNTAADNPSISIAGYAASSILSDAIGRYNHIISNERFTPPADYQNHAPVTNGNLTGLSVKVINGADETLSMDTNESYILDVPVNGQATLTASNVFGALRGLETFSQLLIVNDRVKFVKDTPIHIEDAPAFPHRGLLLDTARNYYSVDNIKHTLDAMSYNKMNVFHWHIVDAQSWPVQSKKYPKLAGNGAYSSSMSYSYNDVASIIDYGKRRGVRVIPEFDMPGHTYIVGETYPNIMSCLNKQPNWDKYAAEPPSGQLNIAKDSAADFAMNIVDEYSALFPDQIFHLGGDEVNRLCWEEDPDVKKYLAAHPNENVESLLDKFYQKVHQKVQDCHKVGMSWEETLFHSNYTPPKDTIIQTWIDAESVHKTVERGYRAVASPASAYYLDCGHGAWLSNFDGNSWCDPYKTWMHIYNYDPLANVTDPNLQKMVLGGEVALWSEQSDDTSLDNYLWPRASAMAETSWSGKKDASGHVRTTEEVVSRLHDQRFRMVARGIMAVPLQPLWCARNPGNCLLPSS